MVSGEGRGRLRMVLSDVDIIRRLDDGTLSIWPIDDRDTQVQPCSVDLRLSPQIKTFRRSSLAFIDPFKTDPSEYMDCGTVMFDEPFILHPGEFILGATIERVEIPADLVAQVDGRSSLGRMGVMIHATAGFIDPGFFGAITLEISCVGVLPVAIYAGMRICQVSFSRLTTPCARPYGPARGSKYQGQLAPEPSRMRRESEKGGES